jgi:eukaryotic-like serine/threonine-protein kinase
MNKIVLTAFCLVLLAGCGPVVTDKSTSQNCDWLSYRCNGSNTGAVLSDCSPDDSQLQLKWQFAAKGAVIQSPVASDGKIYIGSVGKIFYCIDAATGKELWSHDVGDEVSTPAVIANDKVLFGSKYPNLHCLDAQTGEEKWVYNANDQISVPSADSDSVYVGTLAKEMIRINLADGKPVWTAQVNGGVRGSVAFHGNGIVFGCSDGLIHQIDKKTGKVYNITKSSGPITTSLVVENSMLYYTSYDGRIHCYNLETNKEAWSTNIGISQENPPTLWHGFLYFGANNGYFYCLDSRNGTIRWTYDTGVMRRIVGPSAASNGFVWFASEDNYLYCLDAITGLKLWSYKTGDRIWSSPIIENKQIIVGCNDANIYCFGQ